MTAEAGVFVAVVGPSGAGKDTVLDYARNAFADRDDVTFVRREITRPAGAGEEHEPCDAEAFAEAAARGAYALTWRAHGLDYGIPAAECEGAPVVVANISRGSIDEAREKFARTVVVHITVSPEVRLQRILARGREDRAAAERRVSRPADPVDANLEIVNDGTVEEAGETLTAFLRDQLSQTRRVAMRIRG